MSVADILQSVQFVVDQDGNITAAVPDIAVWESFFAMLADIKDRELIRDSLRNWGSKQGWTCWEAFANELQCGVMQP